MKIVETKSQIFYPLCEIIYSIVATYYESHGSNGDDVLKKINTEISNFDNHISCQQLLDTVSKKGHLDIETACKWGLRELKNDIEKVDHIICMYYINIIEQVIKKFPLEGASENKEVSKFMNELLTL